MAIEAWLLKKAEDGDDITGIIDKIYNETNSVALLSILASIANAHPDAFGEMALPLFSNLMFLRYDQARQIQEHTTTFDFRGMWGFPPAYGMEAVFQQERARSDALDHRQQNLENLFIKFQLSSLKEKFLHQMEQLKKNHKLSSHEDDKIAERILMKRIDVSNWVVIERTEEGIHIGPVIDEPDLKEVTVNSKKSLVAMNEWSRLSLWASSVFKDDEKSESYAKVWVDIYQLARKLEAQPFEGSTEIYIKGTNVLAFVASSLVKKHFDELDEGAINWCCEMMCSSIEAFPQDRNQIEWMQRHQAHGSRPSAFLLPLLLKNLSPNNFNYERIKSALALAFTNPVLEIRTYAVLGVKKYMSSDYASFVRRGREVLLWISCEAGQYLGKKWKRENNYQEIYLNALMRGNKYLMNDNPIVIPDVVELSDMESEDLLLALHLSMQDPYELDDIKMLSELLKNLAADFKKADESQSEGTRLTSNYEFHLQFYKFYAEAMFSCKDSSLTYLLQSLIEAVDESGKVVEGIITELIYKADGQKTTERFWKIWTPLSAKIFSSLDKAWRRSDLIKAILFSKVQWKSDTKRWKPLEDNKEFIKIAFTTVGHTQSGFDALNRLLSSVGEFLLPEALIDLNDALHKAERNLLDNKDTRLELEAVMRNAILSYGTQIRISEEMRIAALNLLDELINKGSSLAYQLRELLIAPSRKNAA